MERSKITIMLALARRLLFHAFVLFILFSSAQAFADPTWTEIRSPHFRVITDGSAREGRTVANEFEQMRYVFSINNTAIEAGSPLTIVAASDEATYEKNTSRWTHSNRLTESAKRFLPSRCGFGLKSSKSRCLGFRFFFALRFKKLLSFVGHQL
jgi:hypothetical protein